MRYAVATTRLQTSREMPKGWIIVACALGAWLLVAGVAMAIISLVQYLL